MRDYAYILTEDLQIQKVRLMRGERLTDDILLQKIFYDGKEHWAPVGDLFPHKVDAEGVRDDLVRRRDIAEQFGYGELIEIREALAFRIKGSNEGCLMEIGGAMVRNQDPVYIGDLIADYKKGADFYTDLYNKVLRKIQALHAR